MYNDYKQMYNAENQSIYVKWVLEVTWTNNCSIKLMILCGKHQLFGFFLQLKFY